MLTEQQRAMINWDKVGGLLPAIVQHAQNGEVLMLGYMTPEALEKPCKPVKSPFFTYQTAPVDQRRNFRPYSVGHPHGAGLR